MQSVACLLVQQGAPGAQQIQLDTCPGSSAEPSSLGVVSADPRLEKMIGLDQPRGLLETSSLRRGSCLYLQSSRRHGPRRLAMGQRTTVGAERTLVRVSCRMPSLGRSTCRHHQRRSRRKRTEQLSQSMRAFHRHLEGDFHETAFQFRA